MPRISGSYLWTLGMLTALGPICTDFYLPALPEMAQHLSTTTTLTQLSLTASLIGLGIGQLFFGPLSDRMGRKKPLILSLLLFIVASLLCATTSNIYLLILWRFIQGLAGAGGAVLSRAIARDKYQGSTLTQFFALLMAINGIAPVVSPVIGGYIASVMHWRALFWAMAIMGILLLLASLVVVKETLEQRHPSASLGKAIVRLLKNGRFSAFCFIQAFMLAGLFAYIGSSSFLLQHEYHFTAIQFSLLFGLNGIGLMISALTFSHLAQRYTTPTLLSNGLVLAVLSALLTLMFVLVHQPILALVGLFFAVAFTSGISTLASSAAMNNVSPQDSGTASALLGFTMFFFGGISAPLSGAGGEAMWKMSLSLVICFSVALVINRLRKRH